MIAHHGGMSEILRDLGWDDGWAAAFAPWAAQGHVPGRVTVRHPGQYDVLTAEGEVAARIKGRLRSTAETWAALPTVGDWVAVEQRPGEPMWHLHAVLDRRTRLVRKVKGSATTPQLIAANLTTIVIVMGLTEDYSPKRMERYLTVVHDSGAKPVVVLNKADLLDDELRVQSLAEIRRRAPGCAVYLVSATEGEGLGPLAELLHPGETILLTGSSGAGKSTLINALLGEERQAVGEVRRGDGKGRHTTTTRELFVIPGRGTLIDSPGIRELQLWSVQAEALSRTFCDIEDLVNLCRFSDCSHQNEPGCAVRPAIEEGELDPDRLEHWEQLKRELEVLRQREGERGDVTRRAFKAWRTRSRR